MALFLTLRAARGQVSDAGLRPAVPMDALRPVIHRTRSCPTLRSVLWVTGPPPSLQQGGQVAWGGWLEIEGMHDRSAFGGGSPALRQLPNPADPAIADMAEHVMQFAAGDDGDGAGARPFTVRQ